MPATENNLLVKAREYAEANDPEVDGERIRQLLATVEASQQEAETAHAQQEAVREQVKAANKKIEDAYVELETILPANPLGNLNIGAV